MKTGFKTKLIALLLTFAMLAELSPVGAVNFTDEPAPQPSEETIAEEEPVEELPTDADEPVTGEEKPSEPATVVGEITELREENVKHFRMSDGTNLAVSYGVPIHYKGTDNKWQDIDNTLTLCENRIPMPLSSNNAAEADDEEVYETVNGNEIRQFSKAVKDDGFLFSIISGNNTLSMYALRDKKSSETSQNEKAEINTVPLDSLASVSTDSEEDKPEEVLPIAAKISNPVAERNANNESNQQETSLAEQVEPEKMTSELSYEGVWKNTDLVYQLNGHSVKESIVIQQLQDEYDFAFRMVVAGFDATMNDDGSILLSAGDDAPSYEIPAPYMEDANGDYSDAVCYSLDKDDEGYILSVHADSQWINDSSRALPVVIDPTVVFRSNNSIRNILTSYVNSGRPNSASYQNTKYLRSGYYTNTTETGDPYCTGYTVGLIYVNNLPPVPDGCVVTNSYLEFTQVLYGGISNLNYHRLYATTVNATDNPAGYLSSLTWNSYLNNILPNYVTASDGNAAALDYATEYVRPFIDSDKTMQYEITAAAQKWYNNDTSISRLLVLDDGHNNATNARVTYAGYTYGATLYEPKIYVRYRNTTGIEDYYAYHSQDAGRAGMGYVDDNTLNLTFAVPLISAPSETLPFTLSLVYNSSISNTQYTANGQTIHSLNFSNAEYGYGWKMNVEQTVSEINIQNGEYTKKHLIYTDADGTEHYFYPKNGNSSTTFEDEDGLGLTITITNSSTYTMKDKDGNEWIFTYGYLTEYTSSEGNKLYYAYDGNDYVYGATTWKPSNRTSPHYVSGVWRQNSGAASRRITKLGYSSGHLSYVEDAANRRTTFGYSNGCLTSIGFPDGNMAKYAYTTPQSSSLHFLTKAEDCEAGYKIMYTYSATSRVLTFTEYIHDGVDWISGQSVRAWKQNETYSRFRYFKAGDSTNANGSMVTKHYFDNLGRTVNTITMNADETSILGVATEKYTKNEGTSKKNNRLTNAASSGIQAENLLLNGNIESTTSLQAWTRYGEPYPSTGTKPTDSQAKSSSGGAVNITPRTGNYLMKMYTVTAERVPEVRAQPVYLLEDTTYVFSAYVNTACANSINSQKGPYIAFRSANSNHTELATSRKINYKTNTSVANGWERIEVCFTPTESGKYQVAAISDGVAQVAVFDDLQLERVPNDYAIENDATASSINLIQLGSFEHTDMTSGINVTDWTSQGWTYTSSKAAPSSTMYNTGTYSMTFVPNVTQKRRASQEVHINGSSNTTYILSGWGWTPPTNIWTGAELEGDNSNEKRFFGMIAKVTYRDTSISPDYHYVSFNDDIDGWQFASGVIVPEQRDETVSTITVILATDYCTNQTYMDDISLVAEPVQTYEYDEDGNLIRATDSEGKTESETDDKDRITDYTSLNGVSYHMTYTGDSRNPTTVTSNDVVTTYGYDAGIATSTRVQKNGNSLYLESSASLNDTKDFYETTTDVNGISTSSYYDVAKGLRTRSETPSTVENGEVIEVQYSYDANNDRIEQTKQTGIAELNYTYNNKGVLSQIDRKTSRSGAEKHQAYNFAFNTLGQQKSISVSDGTGNGGIMLASNSYDENNRIKKQGYGFDVSNTSQSGMYIQYSYDLLDRPVHKEYYNGSVKQADYHYVYNAQGDLTKQYAVNSAGQHTEEYQFEYDTMGRLIRSQEFGTGGTPKQRTEHLYDTANRLKSQSWVIGDNAFSETYTYNDPNNSETPLNDGSLASMTTATGDELVYNYDALQRPSTIYAKRSGGSTLFYSFQDYKTTGNKTSSQISGFGYRNSADAIINYNTYDYDVAGNISEINQVTSSGTQQLAAYTYDNQNQLCTESYGGSTFRYSYDTAGNLQSVSVVGICNNYKAFSYDNSDWQDLLTQISISDTSKKIAYEGQTYNDTTDTVSGTPRSGNPINWYNGKTYSNLTWTQGRKLSSLTVKYTDDTTKTVSYTYDMDGIRKSKTVGDTTYTYITQNGAVVHESVLGSDTNYQLDFIYDNSGKPFALIYTNASGTKTTFYYVLNMQGDVVSLINRYGTVYASYTYDAWGDTLTAQSFNANYPYLHIVNPLRYRGYYYDGETGWYYLQSRYYDPAVGRFINADCTTNTGQGFIGYNMFAYCNNNPVANMDFSGEIAISTLILIGSAVIGVAAAGYTAYQMRKAGYDWFDTAFYSIGAGLYAFCTIYSLGASAYELYSYYCMINGMQPITEIGKSSQHITALSPSNASTLPTSSASTYSPPKGGGGVTDRITVGNMTITFGHGGRHLDNSALTPSQVNHAISTDVMKLGLQVNEYCGTGRVQVDGLTICYTAFRRSDTLINVGTYHILGGK